MIPEVEGIEVMAVEVGEIDATPAVVSRGVDWGAIVVEGHDTRNLSIAQLLLQIA